MVEGWSGGGTGYPVVEVKTFTNISFNARQKSLPWSEIITSGQDRQHGRPGWRGGGGEGGHMPPRIWMSFMASRLFTICVK